MQPRVQFLIILGLVVGGLMASPVDAVRPEVTSETIEKGKAIYERSCIFCHGVQGRGDGPAAFFGASFFAPRATNFTVGEYKFRSTASGNPPTDQDLFRTITLGVPGYMPPFEGLTEEDRWHVVGYLKTLNQKYKKEPPEALHFKFRTVPSTPESIAQGNRIFLEFECNSCHGPNARGVPTDFQMGDLKDSFDQPIRQTDLDLTNPYAFKNGFAARDIFRTLMTGLDGSPMPSYTHAFTDQEEDAWHLVNYIRSLSRHTDP